MPNNNPVAVEQGAQKFNDVPMANEHSRQVPILHGIEMVNGYGYYLINQNFEYSTLSLPIIAENMQFGFDQEMYEGTTFSEKETQTDIKMTTNQQFIQLVDCMEEFPHLATGTPQFGGSKSAVEYTWETVASKINAYGPPARTGSEWKKIETFVKITEKKFNSKIPPASGSNSTTNAAVQAAAKAEREEKLRGALKSFIHKERQRKKEEFEAKLEEDRLRKEREARERQNDMTLEETRGQISKLEQKLEELHNQKQQLFLQLKKVLNEDENRKKQQKDNEMYAMQALQAQQASAPQPQVFLPPVRVQHHQMPILTKPPNNAPVKRGRSPSPTQQGYYKTTNYSQPKHEEVRRGADSARVLWNKPHTQYQTPGTLFYQTTSNAPPPQPPPDARGPAIIYAHYNLPLRQGYHLELPPTSSVPVSKSDVPGQKPAQVYHINLDQPTISQGGGSGGSSASSVQSQKPQITMEKISDRYHVEVKHDGPPSHGVPPPHQLPDGVVYTPLIPNMPLHPNVMQISGGPQQNPKPGTSITQNYAPGRSSTGHEQQQLSRQQITVMSGQQPQQPLHYPRRMF